MKRVIELLAKRCLLGRFCLAGNLIAVPIIGANVLFRVSSSTASAISLGTSVTLDAPKDKAGSSYAGYSTLAGDAAANALGGGKGGVAYTAAYHAALAGERSLGTTYANLGGCELQVRFAIQIFIELGSCTIQYKCLIAICTVFKCRQQRFKSW